MVATDVIILSVGGVGGVGGDTDWMEEPMTERGGDPLDTCGWADGGCDVVEDDPAGVDAFETEFEEPPPDDETAGGGGGGGENPPPPPPPPMLLLLLLLLLLLPLLLLALLPAKKSLKSGTGTQMDS